MAHSLRRIRPTQPRQRADTAEPISTSVSLLPMARVFPSGQWGQRANIFAGYAQDDWRATENLTINLGLRYEVHTPWIEAHDQQVNFDLVTGQLIAPNCSKVNLGTAPLTCQQSDDRALQRHLRSKEPPAPDRLCLDAVASRRQDGVPRRLQYLLLSGRHRNEPAPPHQSAVHPG